MPREDLRVPPAVRRRLGIAPGLAEVRFGASDPIDMPGGYNYEISENDRKAFEQALADSRSADSSRRGAALSAINNALGPVLASYPLTAPANLLWEFAKGFFARGEATPSADALIARGYSTAGSDYGAADHTKSIVTAIEWNVAAGEATYKIVAKSNPPGDVGYYVDYAGCPGTEGSARTIAYGGRFGLTLDGEMRPDWKGFGVSTSFACSDPPKSREEVIDYYGANWASFGPDENVVEGTLTLSAGGSYKVCVEDAKYVDGRNFVNQGCGTELPTTDGSAFGMEEMPELGEFGPPEPGLDEPPDVGVPAEDLQDAIDSIKGSPWADDYLGNPEHDPGNLSVPGSGINDLRLDDDIGQSPLAKFRMPTRPGDFSGGLPRPGLRPGDPFAGKIGDNPFGPGKLRRFEPKDPPGEGDFTGTMPPYADETFSKPRCYKNRLIYEIVAELAAELKLDPDSTFVDESCTKRFTGCLEKGSSKFDAMWELADKCGYGVFPDPGGGGEIGKLEPLRVHHGPYHEDVDLFRFEPVYDDFEVYAYVEVFKPAFPGAKPASVVMAVNSVYSVDADKVLRKRVGRGTPEADMMDMAARMARDLRRRTMRIEAAVPYAPAMRVRHQAIVQRPLRRFEANYMVTGLRHDLSDKGYVTVWDGVALSDEESERYK